MMTKVLTPARRARLEKLATYLEALPKSYRHFDMWTYVDGVGDRAALVKYAAENGGVSACGSVACAVGHGPAAGILVPPRMRTERFVHWGEYADAMFVGERPSFWGNRPPASVVMFAWLFGSRWKSIDNHHYGAAARIRFVLANGGAPEGFKEDPARKWREVYAPYRIDAKVAAA